MIAKLTGIVDTVGENFLIIDVNGVGYLVSCSGRTLGAIGHKGEPATVFIEALMRAESLQLYGFKTQEEQGCFCLLTTVQGVGARMALSLLSTLSPSEVYQAIGAEDKALLTRAEGVGPKLASRILTELKDKVPTIIHFPSHGAVQAPSALSPGVEEAISALVNLGYRRFEAVTAVTKALTQVDKAAPLSDLIRQGLSLLARSGT